jgi:hypothetical protein
VCDAVTEHCLMIIRGVVQSGQLSSGLSHRVPGCLPTVHGTYYLGEERLAPVLGRQSVRSTLNDLVPSTPAGIQVPFDYGCAGSSRPPRTPAPVFSRGTHAKLGRDGERQHQLVSGVGKPTGHRTSHRRKVPERAATVGGPGVGAVRMRPDKRRSSLRRYQCGLCPPTHDQ